MSSYRRISLLLALLFASHVGLIAQDLIINSSGETGTSGTNWSLTGTILTVTGTASINPSVISTALSTGNLLVNNTSAGGSILIQNNIATGALSANRTLTFKTSQNISMIVDGTKIDGSGGVGKLSVVFWSDADGNNSGAILIGNNGSSGGPQILTNGGDLVMAGGADDGANSGTANDGIPDGYAAAVDGFVASYTSGVPAAGIGLNASTLSAAGGNIILRAKTALTVSTRAHRIENSTIQTSGSGSITIDGTAVDANIASGWGVNLRGNTVIESGSGAIRITAMGSALGSNSRGFVSETGTGKIQSLSGAIVITDQRPTGLTSTSNYTGLSISPSGFDIGKGSLASSSSNVTITSDVLSVTTPVISSTGSFTIEPHSSSFPSAFTYPTLTASGITGLTIGKAGNTSAITVGTATTVAGPINIFSGNLTLSAALTATGNTITLTATGAVTQSAAITASKLQLSGIGTFNLSTLSNNVGTIAAGTSGIRVGNLTFVNSGAFEIGTVTTAGIFSTGSVQLESFVGNVTISANINTTNTASTAIRVYAEKTKTAGDVSGGQIIISGSPSITTGTGGRASLYSGTPATSTGLTSLVGLSNVRYNVDLNTADASISPAIGAGVYALYRSIQLSSVADLSNLTVSLGTLTPSFNASTLSYYIMVPNATTTMTFTPTKLDANATLKINGVTATSGSAYTATLSGLRSDYTILVTAQDGATVKSYILKIYRQQTTPPSAPGTWKNLLKDIRFDPNNDQQSTADTDLVGNATDVMMQSQQAMVAFSDGTLDRVYYWRVRLGNTGKPNTSFYMGLDVVNNQRVKMVVEANLKAQTPYVSFHKQDPSKDGSGPSQTGWLNSSNDPNIERKLTSRFGTVKYYVTTGQATTNNDVDSPTGGDNNGIDTWLEFTFTENSFKSFTLDADNDQKTGDDVFGIVFFTSTSQTANGDVGGINDKTANLSQTWVQLGNMLTTSLNAASDETLDPPSVFIISAVSTTGTGVINGVWNGDRFPGCTLSVTVNGQTYTFVKNTNTYTPNPGLTFNNLSWSITLTGLAPGTYPITATMLDGLGNTGTANGTLIVSAISVNNLVTEDTTPTLTGGSDVGAGQIVTVNILNSSNVLVAGPLTATTTTGGNWSLNINNALPLGSYTVNASVTTSGGNTATGTGTLTIGSPPVNVNLDVVDRVESVNKRPPITGTSNQGAGEAIEVILRDAGGNDLTLTTTTQSGGSWTVTPGSDLANGTYTVFVTLTKTTGAVAIAQGTLVMQRPVTIVATAPSGATITYNASLAKDILELTINSSTTSVAEFDEGENRAVTWTLPSGADKDLFQIDGTGKLTLKNPVDAGTYYVVVRATDASGIYKEVTVILTRVPVAITVTADAKSKTYGDNDPTLTYTVSPSSSGAVFTGALARANGNNVGTYAITLGSLSAGVNFNITYAGANLTISAKALTLSGSSGLNKTYDGTTAMPSGQSGYGSLSGVVGSDNVTVSGAPTYAQATVGSGISIQQGTVTLSGSTATNYSLTWTNGSGNITAATLTATAISDAKFVTRADVAGYAGVTITGFVNGETVALVNTSGLSITRSNSAVESAGTYTGVLVPTGLTAPNYSFTYVNGTYTILPANQLMVRVSNASVVYGSEPAYTVSSAAYLDANLNEIVNLTSRTTISGKSVTITDGVAGEAKFDIVPVSPSLSTAGKLKVNTYSLEPANITETSNNFSNLITVVGSLAVSKKEITAFVSGGKSKQYDGTRAMPGLSLSLNGLLTNDVVTASGSGLYDTRDVGQSKSYAVTGITFSGTDAGNYVIAASGNFNGQDGEVTPKTVTLSGASGVSKVYDGNDAMPSGTIGYGALTGVLGNDDVLVTGAPVFSQTIPGSGLKILQGTVALGGLDDGNYQLSWSDGTGNEITKATLSVAVNNNSKFFGAVDAAGYAGATVTGFITGDNLSNSVTGTLVISRSNSSIEDAGVYTGVLDGSGLISTKYNFSYVAGDYTIVAADQLLVEVADVSAVYGTDPVYVITKASYKLNGSNLVDLTSAVSITGNTVRVSDTGSGVADFNLSPINPLLSTAGNLAVGSYQLEAVNVVVTGANFGNLVIVTGSLTVTPKQLNAALASPPTRTYDGTTALPTFTIVLTGLLTNDVVTAGGAGTYGNKSAGTAKTYTVSGLTLSGSDAGNYVVQGGNTFTGSNGVITKRKLNISAVAANKIYDGLTNASTTSSDDRVAGDLLDITFVSAFGTAVVGVGKSVTLSNVVINGVDNANYEVDQTTCTPADILKASLVVSVSSANKVFGAPDPTFTVTYSGFVNGENQTSLTGSLVFNRSVGEAVGDYPVSASGLNAANYDITYQPGLLTILSIDDRDGDGVTNVDEVIDGTDPADDCDYQLASRSLQPASSWNNGDCDGDGDKNATDPSVKDPCVFAPGSIADTGNTVWQAADCDGDGLTNNDELTAGTNPQNPDSDGDGVTDGKEVTDQTDPTDNCSFKVASQTATPNQAWLDADCDQDGLKNGEEKAKGTDPLNKDSDGDGVSDATEIAGQTDPNNGCSYNLADRTLTVSVAWGNLDCDGDGDKNSADPDAADPCKFTAGSTPVTTNTVWRSADCDADGESNGFETEKGTDPVDLCSYTSQPFANTTAYNVWKLVDCDNDGLTNEQEVQNNSDPKNPDSDGDGVVDGIEVANNTNPADGCSYTFTSRTLTTSTAWGDLDCDGDGDKNSSDPDATDPCKFTSGSTPLITSLVWRNADCDGDGQSNGIETDNNTNPANACSYTVQPAANTAAFNVWKVLDCDNDGLTNELEVQNNTDAQKPDSDGDGVIDGKEVSDSTNPTDGCSFTLVSRTLTTSIAWGNLDCDGDGNKNSSDPDVTNPCSFTVGSTPVVTNQVWRAADCDGDGETNGLEVDNNTNAASACSYTTQPAANSAAFNVWKTLDCDSDGLTNEQELAKGTDVTKSDTDGDGVKDGKESTDNTNALDPCSLLPASVTVAPSPNWGSLDCDGDGNPNSSDPAVFVATARDDSGSVAEGETFEINVLDNDDFRPGPGITLVRNGGTATGTVEFGDPAGNLLPGQMSYVPAQGESGLVTVGYKVCKDLVCATANVTIDVLVPNVIEVPKVITPNGDGFNDIMEVKGLTKYPENELVIFNRWGNEVFRAAPYNNDWDGRSTNRLTIGKGSDAKVPVGTYFYILKLDGGNKTSGYIYVAY